MYYRAKVRKFSDTKAEQLVLSAVFFIFSDANHENLLHFHHFSAIIVPLHFSREVD